MSSVNPNNQSIKDRWAPELYSFHSSASKIFFEGTDIFYAAKLGDGPILATDGYGGWVEVPRPKNKPLTRWEGGPALKLKIPLLFDQKQESSPIRTWVNQVYRLGRESNGREEPDVFRLTSDAMPHSGRKWVMVGTPEVERADRNRDGKLIIVMMTIEVMEYVEPDRIRFRKRPKRMRRVVAKKGDTINKIAHRVAKGKGKKKIRDLAKRMAKLNGVRDRNKRLKTGRKIKVPN